MTERFPPIAPVRTRGAFASHVGPRREHDEQRVLYLTDEGAALALVVRGMGSARSGRPVADRVADMCTRIFRERTSSMLDDLAEVWWRAEHGAAEGARVRPFSSLPIADRAELRTRVKKLLVDRRPDALGDQAVLEAETTRLLDLPASALKRAASQLERLADEKGGFHRGEGASAVAVIFAAGKASIAHVGDCRVVRVRRGKLEALTRPHTLLNAWADHPDTTPEQLAAVPANVIMRALGMPSGSYEIEVITSDLERRDVFLLMNRGLAASFDDDDVRRTILAHGALAATTLVERGKESFPGHSLENISAVGVEIV